MVPRGIVLIAVVLLSTDVLAQSMTGRAIDSAGQPLPGVAVWTMPASGGPVTQTTTAIDGTYQFQALPEGMYRVDFELRGFDTMRRNGIMVSQKVTAVADATLQINKLGECLQAIDNPRLVYRAGRVLDSAGRPLPRARLEVVTGKYEEVARADRNGRFSIRLPLDTTWHLVASDSGFHLMTQEVSGSRSEPIVFRLTYDGDERAPARESLVDACQCQGNLFRDPER